MKRFASLLNRIGLRRPDEMERHILFRAQRNAYYFLIAALILLTFYESYQTLTNHTAINLIPCALLVIATLIQTVTQLVLQRNAVKDDEESFEPKPYRLLILLMIVIAVLSAAVAGLVIMAGVRL